MAAPRCLFAAGIIKAATGLGLPLVLLLFMTPCIIYSKMKSLTNSTNAFISWIKKMGAETEAK